MTLFHIVNVIIDNSDKLWFNSGQLSRAIGYTNYIKAIKQHTDKSDRLQLKFINHSYDIKQHPQTVYLSESGMYKLILRSKMTNTKKFSDWILLLKHWISFVISSNRPNFNSIYPRF